MSCEIYGIAEKEKRRMVAMKRHLCSLQRQTHASKRQNFVKEIMVVSENDSKTFSKLVQKQRSNNSSVTEKHEIDDGIVVTRQKETLEESKQHF